MNKDFKKEVSRLHEIYRRNSPDNFLLFAQGLEIPSAYGPQLFKDCIHDYQLECFQKLAPSLHQSRDGEMPECRRFWVERTKKGGKDSDLAIALLWPCCFATRPMLIQVGAADKKQAGIVKRRIKHLVHYNEWLNDYVEIHNWQIVNKKGLASIEILSADIAGSHGETPDILLLNELSHVTKWEFIENLLDNARGVPRGIIIAATNAGFKGTEAEELRNEALRSSAWKYFIYSKPAPWISEEDLKEAEATNSRSRFRRLWWGEWVSGKGDAFDEEDIDAVFKEYLVPNEKAEPGWIYIAGLDLGVSHDHSGLVVLGINRNDRKLRIFYMRAWEPRKKDAGRPEVDLIEVETECLRVHRIFNISWFGYDPTQAALMSQRLRKRNLPMREMSFASSTNLTEMAVSLKQIIESNILECFPDERLRRDFGKLTIVEKVPSGYKLEAVSDKSGHADVGIALAICCPQAVRMLAGTAGLQADDGLDYEEEGFQEDELDDWPEELREIYETYTDMDREREEELEGF